MDVGGHEAAEYVHKVRRRSLEGDGLGNGGLRNGFQSIKLGDQVVVNDIIVLLGGLQFTLDLTIKGLMKY